MTCIDCKEPVTETERLNSRTCRLCHGLLHAECSMVGLDEEDLCEVCHRLQSTSMMDALKALGAA